jgi:tRNA pseudouridine38-40 synthase
MRTLKLTLSYDGTRFVGWQRQTTRAADSVASGQGGQDQVRGEDGRAAEGTGESIQGLLEDALARFEGAPVSVQGAGRTDAGVHALGQVASLRVTCAHDAATLTRALNVHLPSDIRVLSIEEVPPDFHARFSATSKTYRYRIRNGPVASPFERAYVWHLPEPLSLDAMKQAAAALVGMHDFAAFRSVGGDVSSTVRTISRSEWHDEAGLLTYEICGNGFLRHMVRAIVGTLVEIGRSWRPPHDIESLLSGGTRAEAGATAPPHGLFLVRVDYD